MANGPVKYVISAKKSRGTTLLRLLRTFQSFLWTGERLHISRGYFNAFLTFPSSHTQSRHPIKKIASICRLVELQEGISEVLALATSWHVEGAIFAPEAKIVYAIQKFGLAATARNIFNHHRADLCLKWAIIFFCKL